MKILPLTLLFLLGIAATDNTIYASKSKHEKFVVTVDKNLSEPWVTVDIWSIKVKLDKEEKHHSVSLLRGETYTFHILKGRHKFDHSISKIIITYPNGTQRRKTNFKTLATGGDDNDHRNSIVWRGTLTISDTPGNEAVITTQKAGVTLRISPGLTQDKINAITLNTRAQTNPDALFPETEE